MIKAAKKFKKLWSRKKRRKKTHQLEPYYHHHAPSTCHCCCSYSTPAQPSAPPLPPWLEHEQTYETISAPGVQPFPELVYPSEAPVPSQEISVETNPIFPTLPANTTSILYQQYMDPNPIYGVPVLQTAIRKRSAGFFGCIVNFGANLIRCFCPCFRIQEVAEIVA